MKHGKKTGGHKAGAMPMKMGTGMMAMKMPMTRQMRTMMAGRQKGKR